MKNENIKISYPNSEKIYKRGTLYPELKVGMRRILLTPTVTNEGGKRIERPNKPVVGYDTRRAYDLYDAR